MSDKIQSMHLERIAFVYVRQSSLQQVRDRTEGQRQQYALVERARALGFRETVLIDEDQGRSGSGQHERPGFGLLLSGVSQGEVGAVFALEASRLARKNRDWHHLVDLCALTDTLIIDAEGVYDARQLNDRLLLGLKGTMSEFELGLLRQRARQAFNRKSRAAMHCGNCRWGLFAPRNIVSRRRPIVRSNKPSKACSRSSSNWAAPARRRCVTGTKSCCCRT